MITWILVAAGEIYLIVGIGAFFWSCRGTHVHHWRDYVISGPWILLFSLGDFYLQWRKGKPLNIK